MTTDHKKLRVAVYLRVSTTEQADKYGLDLQRRNILNFLEYQKDKYTLDRKRHIYEDINCSGASAIEDREGLTRLFEDAKKGEFDVVCVWKIDRFFRKILFLLEAMEELSILKISFISSSEPGIDTSSMMGKFMIGLLGILAELERNNILERTMEGKISAANAGRWLGGKSMPYGYDPNAEGKMTVCEEEAEMVRRIFSWFVDDRCTVYAIQEKLNALNIPTKGDIVANKMRSEGKLVKEFRTANRENFWLESTVGKILRQEAYSGVYFYNKTKNVRKKGSKTIQRVQRPHDEWIPIMCEQIIDRVRSDKAAILLKNNVTIASRNAKKDYLLSGKIECGICGGKYVGYTKKKFKGKNIIAEYTNYRCRKKNASLSSEKCSNREVSGALIEEKIWKQIEALLRDPKAFIKKIEQENTKKVDVAGVKKQLRKVNEDLNALSGERERIVGLFESGLSYQGLGEVEGRLKKLDDKKTTLLNMRDEYNSKILSDVQKVERLSNAKMIASKYSNILDQIDFPTKKQIIQAFVRRITLSPEKAKIELLLAPPKNDNLESVCGAAGRD